MKTLVTGGTGFLGRDVVRRLAGPAHEVRCLVRRTSDPTALAQLAGLGVHLVWGDLADKKSLFEGMKGCDRVLNVGAAYSFWTREPRSYRAANVDGVRNVMESALEAGVSKVVHVSTVIVYGKPAESPVNESTPVGPVRFSEYAETKYEGEVVAWRMHQTKKLPLVVVYPGGVLGPGDPKASGDYVRNLMNRKMPATVFDKVPFPWVHVRDVADGIIRAAEKENNIGQKYLLVAENLTFGQINQLVSEISRVRLPRLRMPTPMAVVSAAMLTALSRITRRPPPWGMSSDQIRTMKEGLIVDGGKAVRELGLKYTPVRVALEEAIASYHR